LAQDPQHNIVMKHIITARVYDSTITIVLSLFRFPPDFRIKSNDYRFLEVFLDLIMYPNISEFDLF
jgi:hypothetical protein